MLALVVATVFNAGFGIVVRDAQPRNLDLLTVGLINYAVAAACYAAWSLWAELGVGEPRTVLIGTIGGVFYAGGFLLMLGPMRWRGLSIVAAFVGLSVLVPLTASLVIWHESITGIRAAGAILALIAIPLLSLDQGVTHGLRLTWRMGLGLAGLFFVNGGAWSIQKWYQTTGLSGERPVYFLYLFGVAALVILVAWAVRPRRPSGMSIAWGVMLGACNVFANLALLAALDRLPGAVAFPVMQAGIMIVATAFAAAAWRETPGRLGAIGIAIAVAAVALINLA